MVAGEDVFEWEAGETLEDCVGGGRSGTRARLCVYVCLLVWVLFLFVLAF